MSKTTKSIWLRRAAQLSLAGTLVFPLSLSGADAPDDSGTRPHMKFFEARNKDLVKFFENLETARREAMSKAGNGQYQDAVKELEALLKSLQDKQGDMAVAKTEELKNNILRIQRVWSSDLMQTAQNLALIVFVNLNGDIILDGTEPVKAAVLLFLGGGVLHGGGRGAGPRREDKGK